VNRTAKIATWTVAALVVAGLAVGAGSAIAIVTAAVPHATTPPTSSSERSTTRTPEPSATFPTSEQERVGGAENCHPPAQIKTTDVVNADGNLVGRRGELLAEPIDFGPREGASGTVNLDGQGRIVSYTTVAGDNWDGIETRLCMDYASIARYNFVGTHPAPPYYERPWTPGDTLILRPDPSVVMPRPGLH